MTARKRVILHRFASAKTVQGAALASCRAMTRILSIAFAANLVINRRTYEPFFPLIATALIYYLIIWLVTALLSIGFKAINNRNRREDRILKKIKT